MKLFFILIPLLLSTTIWANDYESDSTNCHEVSKNAYTSSISTMTSQVKSFLSNKFEIEQYEISNEYQDQLPFNYFVANFTTKKGKKFEVKGQIYYNCSYHITINEEWTSKKVEGFVEYEILSRLSIKNISTGLSIQISTSFESSPKFPIIEITGL